MRCKILITSNRNPSGKIRLHSILIQGGQFYTGAVLKKEGLSFYPIFMLHKNLMYGCFSNLTGHNSIIITIKDPLPQNNRTVTRIVGWA